MFKHKFLTLFVALIATTALWAQNNVITYTASAKLTETTDSRSSGLHTNAFNVGISSHEFSDGTGTITYSGEITKIGEDAFTTTNYFFEMLATIYDFCGLTSITIPNSVTTIGKNAFYGRCGLTSLTIPDSVTMIGEDAFHDVNNIVYSGTATGSPWGAKCVNGYVEGYLVYSDASKTTLCACSSAATGEIIIPNSVTTIGSRAFYGCTGLTSVTIPSSVTSIGDGAFPYVNNIVYSGTATWDNNDLYWGAKCVNGYIDGYLVYSDASKTTLCGCSAAATGDITIPNTVTTIGDFAFYGCTGLTSVTIGNSVTTIGSHAFVGCSGLTSITIPNSVTTIGYCAFHDCTGLTSVTIGNSVTTIGNYAFSGCSGLTSVIWNAKKCKSPNSWISAVFPRSQVTSSFVFGDEVEVIPSYLCYGMSLTSVTIPHSVTEIGESAFENCRDLTSVTIPNSVTEIGESAFEDCYGLTSVTIPNSVTSIGSWAFSGCKSIKKVYVTSPKYPFEGIEVSSIITKAFTATTPQYILQNVAHISMDNTPTCVLVHVDLSKMGTSQYAKLALDFAGTKYELNSKESTVIFTGLTPASTNQATFYSQLIGDSQWREGATIEISTGDLALTTLTPKVVSAGTAIVAAETNISDYETNVGFEWRKYDAPSTMPSKSGGAIICNGIMEGKLLNLGTDSYWNVRPYYEAADGTRYYDEWITFDPSDFSYFEPTVHTYALATSPTANKVQVRGYVMTGTDDVTEQGFEYWFNGSDKSPRRMPSATPDSIYRVTASGQVMTAVLEDLAYSTTYTCRAYAVAGGETYYGEEVQFLTPEDPRPIYTLSVIAGENGSVNETVAGQYREGEQVTLIATPDEGYTFKEWSDGTPDNPYTITIMSDTTLTATFEVVPQYTVTALVNDEIMGMVTGGGTFYKGTKVTLTATANDGYRFIRWDNDEMDNPLTFTLRKDVTLTAIFEEISEGIDDVTDNQKSQVKSQKVIHNGILYIRRNGKTYNVSGQKVK